MQDLACYKDVVLRNGLAELFTFAPDTSEIVPS